MSKKSGNYEVGYGKPPKHTQFKKGQSGNRKGRPKGAANKVTDNSLYAIIEREASREVSVVTSEGTLTMTMANAVVRTMVQLAAKGNTRAMAMLFEKLNIICEKGLSEKAMLTKTMARNVESVFESMTTEQLIELENILESVTKTTPPSPLPTRPSRRGEPKRPTDPDQ